MRNKEIKEITVAEAVQVLKKALKKDGELYFAYQSNIAMAFHDTFHAAVLKKEARMPKDFYTLCNQAAKNFLNVFLDA